MNMDKEVSYNTEFDSTFPNVVAEAKCFVWGGDWTKQKLDIFENYVKAYLTIMNSFRHRYNWKLIYFDGFAGSGERNQKIKDSESESVSLSIGEEFVLPQELEVYQGAAERVVKLEKQLDGFDYYYFVEKDSESCNKLKLKLGDIDTKGCKVFRNNDVNVELVKLANGLSEHPNFKCLCMLDPFGMSINWTSLEMLEKKSVDLWILLPSGVIINRLLRRNGELLYPERLESFFGLDAEEIKQWFYEKKEEVDLFGEKQWYEKKDNSIERIAELYCKRLSELFKYVTKKPLVMRNKHNVPIYHFVFASNNANAQKIAQQIITKRQ